MTLSRPWRITAVALAFGVLAGRTKAQFGGVVYDPTQSVHAIHQIQQEIQQLAILRNNVQILMNEYQQIKANAQYFSHKAAWRGIGNQILRNWAPNTYGAIGPWNIAALFGSKATQGWQNVSIAMKRNPYMLGMMPGTSPEYAYAASVDTFDGAGPTALQTLGNARAQQTQMATAITNLQTAAQSGAVSDNSEVDQLNLLAAGTVQQLEMQQTSNNVLTSLLEQQTIANKIQRDVLADHLNFQTELDQIQVAQGPQWGANAAQAIAAMQIQ